MKRHIPPSVAAVFAGYPDEVRTKLLELRELIFSTADEIPQVGPLEEALKWGQPSYLTSDSGSGSTIRMDALKGRAGEYALFFHCQTSLVETFRKKFGNQLHYEGNRALRFSVTVPFPQPKVAWCIEAALTYHLGKKPRQFPEG